MHLLALFFLSWAQANNSPLSQRRKVESSVEYKPSTRFMPLGGRNYTVSVAIPTSILSE